MKYSIEIRNSNEYFNIKKEISEETPLNEKRTLIKFLESNGADPRRSGNFRIKDSHDGAFFSFLEFETF